jgi:tetratricopeptide (TPR) repeat protein
MPCLVGCRLLLVAARRALIALLVVLLSATAQAAPPRDDADTQAAKRHFRRAAELYEKGFYEEALREFREAQRLKPLPASEYHIGKTLRAPRAVGRGR